MYETELDQHMHDQDQIDAFTFCVGCCEIVYLHSRDTYETCQNDGVICAECIKQEITQSTIDAAANDAELMSFEDWQEHWCAFYGVPVPR